MADPAGRAAAGLEARRRPAGALQRLWIAALGAGRRCLGLVAFALVSPRKRPGRAGLVRRDFWLIGGALLRAGRAGQGLPRRPGPRSRRRLTGLPRGAWGMTLAHAGLGVFVLGACVRDRLEGGGGPEPCRAGSRSTRRRLPAGPGPTSRTVDGPNYERRARDRDDHQGRRAGSARPSRSAASIRPAGQTTSEVAICAHGAGRPLRGAGRAPGRRGRPAGLAGAGLRATRGRG